MVGYDHTESETRELRGTRAPEHAAETRQVVEILDQVPRGNPVVGRGYSGDPTAQRSDVTGGVRMPKRKTSGAHDHHVSGHS